MGRPVTSAPVKRRKEGDTDPLFGLIRDEKRRPVPLHGATVTFLADQQDGFAYVVALCEVVDPDKGRVSYTPGPQSMRAGVWRVEFKVDWLDGERKTAPGSGFITLVIEPDLT